MGFMVPFIPTIAGAIGGIFGGKKATSAAQQRSPEEAAALGGAQSAAGTLTSSGTTLMNTGVPYIQNAGNYYNTLLEGNRPAMARATAGPRAAITDQERGAMSGLERSGVRGGVRDLAKAEISRDTAAKTMGLTTNVAPWAANSLGQLGTTTIGQAGSMFSSAGNIWGNLLNQGAGNRYYARQEGQNFGSSIGGLIADILRGTGKFNPKTPSAPGTTPGTWDFPQGG